MKIDKLRKEAVRRTGQIEDVVHLSDEEMKQVVGGDGTDGGPVIDPETCAIHFYYPADALA